MSVILYSSDIHGNHRLYKELLSIAQQQKVEALILGGDLLPKNFDKSTYISAQEEFLKNWFHGYLQKFKNSGIKVFGIMGNDDAASLSPIFESFEKEGLFTFLNGRLATWKGLELIGFPCVPATPFVLKDWELLDYDGMKIPHQLDKPVISSANGLELVSNLNEIMKIKGTIRQALALLPIPNNPQKTIYVIHSPPSDLGLDMCEDGKCVGSVSVRGFLKKMNPLISLHGHIHESPRTNRGLYCTSSSGWFAVQPGQVGRSVCAVIFDSDNPVGTIRHTIYHGPRC